MPLPNPNAGETMNAFVSRCMGNETALDEFPDQAQRAAVCHSQWRRRNQNNSETAPMGHFGLKTQSYTIREEMHQDRKHLVVPVIMMVEGVHVGSHGPLLHLAEEMGRFPGAWNGIPISVHHPRIDGAPVPCNAPDVIDSQAVGRVYNTQMDGHRLRAEAWIDAAKIAQVSPEALAYILEKKPLDVSVGVFSDDEEVTGDWNGETYAAIARNHRPDHLALLPGGEGACSWSDGCGVRTHQKEEVTDLFKGLQPGDYRLKTDGSIEPIANNEKGVATMAEKKEVKPCCPEKVELLIQSEATQWGEGDREFLLTMTAEQLEKLAPVEVKTEKVEVEVPALMTQEQAVQVLNEQLGDPNKFLNLLPAETRASVEHGLKLYKAHRAEVIDKITANSDGVYTAEELDAMSMDALDKLARVIKVPTDFTPLGGGNPAPGVNQAGTLLPPGVE